MSSLIRVDQELQKIANTLERVTDSYEVNINKDGLTVRAVATLAPLFFIDEAVTYWSRVFGMTVTTPQRDVATVEYFKKVFGEKRLERITNQIHCEGAYTKKHIQKLFLRVGEVLSSDVQELFDEIKGKSSSIRFLDEAETGALRKFFSDVSTVDECSNAQLDALMAHLVPFSNVGPLFLNNVPRMDETKLTSPKSYASLGKRVLIYEQMRTKPVTEQQWIMYLTKNLTDLEIPTGVVFRGNAGGYVKVHKVVHGGGAYKYFLKSFGKAASETGNFILYRGTSPFPSATDSFLTLVEDFRLRLGSNGPKVTFEETRTLLTDQAAGFIQEGNEKITAVSMSLGSAHAMRDTLLHRIDRLITVASPGIDRKTCKVFAEKINKGTLGFVPSIEHNFEAEDIIDQFGAAHLGAGCDPSKIKITIRIHEPGNSAEVMPLDEEINRIAELRKVFTRDAWHEFVPKQVFGFLGLENFPNWLCSIPQAGIKLLMGIFVVHIRNTLLIPHRVLEISNQNQDGVLQSILSHQSELCDKRWEQLRKVVPIAVSKL